ncbi:hypothetical protein [Flavobacterium pectinovorum]|uniref:hypothetical protein n=1 Tax=Flavobacterium pectinovorum TaxID=29533 RepID=UPI0013757273|nr:hypothetical protein [Flavobacterium pectinovorum]
MASSVVIDPDAPGLPGVPGSPTTPGIPAAPFRPLILTQFADLETHSASRPATV